MGAKRPLDNYLVRSFEKAGCLAVPSDLEGFGFRTEIAEAVWGGGRGQAQLHLRSGLQADEKIDVSTSREKGLQKCCQRCVGVFWTCKKTP